MATVSESSLWENRKCLAICVVVSIANMQYGLDLGVVNSLQAMPGFVRVFGHADASASASGGYVLGSVFQQLIGSLLTLGSFLSSLAAGVFARHCGGRRAALWSACGLSVVGAAVQIGTADSKAAVYAGRLVLGVGNGFLVTFSNIYTAEVAPAHLRAVLVALFSEWVNVGSIVGAAVTNATRDRLDRASYRIPLATVFVVPVVLAVGLLFVPESPRYLLEQGDPQGARRALERLRPGGGREPAGSAAALALEIEWVEMVRGHEAEMQREAAVHEGSGGGGGGGDGDGASSSPQMLDVFRGTDLRRTLLCYGVIATQTGSGVWFVIGYATYFLTVSGLTVAMAFRYVLMNTCLGLVGVNIGLLAMRHWTGRRGILMAGALVQAAWMLAMAVAATVAPGTVAARNCLIAFIGLFQLSYNACVGAASYPVATELVSTRLRSWTVGSAVSLGYFLAWLTGFCSPYFINPAEMNWGAKYGYIWAGSNLCCFVFFFFFIPELKGRSLEEIDELFANRVSAWKFKTHATTILDDAVHEVQQRKEMPTATTETVEDTVMASTK